jgi:hypothetical protein
MSRCLRPVPIGAAGAIFALGAACFSLAESPRDTSTPARPDAPAITVAKETTHFIAPLDAEGYLDCIAALNAHYGKGVALSENAAELIIEAVGAADNTPDTMNKVRASLGMSPLTDGGRYLVNISAYAKELGGDGVAEALQKELTAAREGPWADKDLPRIAELLRRNAQPLALIHQAVERPNYFRPFTLAKPGLTMMSVLLPDVQIQREIAVQLEARAMQHMHAGRLDEARQDLYDMHRLARCTGRGMSIIEGLVGIAIDAMASHGDNTWANQQGVTAGQLAAYREQLAALPFVTDLMDRIDHVERLFLIDVLQHMARGTLESGESRAMFAGPEDATKARSMVDPSQLIQAVTLLSVDWDTALIESNRFYDDIVVAGRITDRTERLGLYDQWERKLKQERARVAEGGPAAAAFRFVISSSKSRGRDMGSLLSTLLLPAVKQATAAEESGKMRIDMAQLALALAQYRLVEGAYPERLDALSPALVKSIPSDVFSGQPLQYTSDGATYHLYSIGRNEKDDGGLPGEGKDDIVFSDPVLP